MYQGRHCNYSDYRLLEKISDKFLLLINRDNFCLDEAKNYLDTFSDFDFEIASKIRTYLNKISTDRSGVINKITELLEELRNNVLVDVREHN